MLEKFSTIDDVHQEGRGTFLYILLFVLILTIFAYMQLAAHYNRPE